jgi:hypothetical protein
MEKTITKENGRKFDLTLNCIGIGAMSAFSGRG